MNQHSILQSNLLDIIFENRNKDYGAYALRKSYNGRIRIALLSMMGISLFFCLLISKKSSSVLNLPQPIISIPGTKVAEYHPQPRQEPKAIVNISHPRKTALTEFVPKIVDSVNINKLPATPLELPHSLNMTGVSEIDFAPGEEGQLDKFGIGGEKTKASSTTKVNKSGPLDVADIMPQYPGGIRSLLNFLKKNLHTPEDVEDGDEISVKVKFVVNYDGKLESFNVVKSGGASFDNEVLRVLKKMPLWIPGKSNGENVSV
ncbi:MAG: energy transducer TonB, partial [Ginsengibacter sp.]